MENAKKDFVKFCNDIKADVDINEAISEFDIIYNSFDLLVKKSDII